MIRTARPAVRYYAAPLAAVLVGLAFVVATLLDVASIANAEPGAATRAATVAPRWTTRPCHYEDSVDCAWDASAQGNGIGHSFVVRAVPGRAHLVCVFYTAPRYARHHDHCTATRRLAARADVVAGYPDVDGARE